MLFSNLGITEEEMGVPNAGRIVYTEINLNIELVLSLMIRSDQYLIITSSPPVLSKNLSIGTCDLGITIQGSITSSD